MAGRTPLSRSDLAIVVLFGVLLIGFWAVRSVFVLVAFALLLAYGLDPLVRRLQLLKLPGGRRVSRGVASASLILMLIVVIVLAVVTAAPVLGAQVAAFLERLPSQLARLSTDLRERAATADWARQLVPVIDGLSADTSALLPQLGSWVLHGAASVFARLQQVFGLLLLPVFTFYLMTDGPGLRDGIVAFLPEAVRASILSSRGRVHRALQSYVRGQAIVCLIMGTVTGTALALIGMPDALLLALLVGLAEIVPLVGATVALITIFLSGLTVDLTRGLIGVLVYLIFNWLLGTFVTPRIMGRELKVHPFVVMLSVLVGAQLLGPAGAILALPAAAVLQALAEDAADERRPVASRSSPAS